MSYIYNKSRLIYISKINKVQDYIEEHLDEELSVDKLSNIANFSKFHFQRIYRHMTGESLYNYIKRLRLEKAQFLLGSNKKRSIQDIALSSGYSNQASFAKAFKLKYKINASEYRANVLMNTLQDSINGKVFNPKMDYTIPVELTVQNLTEDTRVIYIRHTGPYKGNENLFSNLFSRLYSYANKNNYINRDSKWYVIYHDFEDITIEEKLRMSVCMSINESVKTEGEFGSMILKGGKYAVGKFCLKADQYQLAWNYMLSKWLPESNYLPDDRMTFEYYPPQQYNKDKEERVVKIFIPITPL